MLAALAATRSQAMTTRTTSKIVTFARPFTLKGVDRILPPGEYRVVTDEELIEELSFPVYRRMATMIKSGLRYISPVCVNRHAPPTTAWPPNICLNWQPEDNRHGLSAPLTKDATSPPRPDSTPLAE